LTLIIGSGLTLAFPFTWHCLIVGCWH